MPRRLWTKGEKVPGAGRPKGTPNRLTTDIRAAIEAALDKLGGVSYLVQVGRDHPEVFVQLVKALLPKEVKVGQGLGLGEAIRAILQAREDRRRLEAGESIRPAEGVRVLDAVPVRVSAQVDIAPQDGPRACQDDPGQASQEQVLPEAGGLLRTAASPETATGCEAEELGEARGEAGPAGQGAFPGLAQAGDGAQASPTPSPAALPQAQPPGAGAGAGEGPGAPLPRGGRVPDEARGSPAGEGPAPVGVQGGEVLPP